jgi:UDP-3-O-[3-hydroxymyristoyl] glucosamine N-acyltransferase
MRDSIIEDDVTIEPHSTIGATGVAWIWDQSTQTRIMQPQTGLTRIKRGSFIGTDVTVVRGSVNETTTIGEGCVIAHGSKIGHGCQIGPECHFANNISLAGNVTLGKQCFLGSGAVVRPQVKLADKTVVGAGAVVIRSTHEAGLTLTGVPANSKKSIGDRLTGVPKPLED